MDKTNYNNKPLEVLVAEDDKLNALLLEKAFNHLGENVRLFVVNNGQSVLDYLHGLPPFHYANRPDIIFLDVNMPKKNGHEVLQELRADRHLKNIPVIMLSGSSAENDVMRSYENQADAYIQKPTGLDEMKRFTALLHELWDEMGLGGDAADEAQEKDAQSL